METLSTRGRAVRVAATAVAALLLLLGTVWGQDDDFPFGPFRMYSTAPEPDEPTRRHPGRGRRRDRRSRGAHRGATAASGGPRSRASSARTRPTRPGCARSPTRTPTATRAAPALVEVRIVIRWDGVQDSRPTGTYTDETVVAVATP